MAVSSTSSIADIVNAKSASSTPATTDTTIGADRFLKLLVAQMQNQDPLNPMDNAAVTSQMAQINTVTGIEKLNTSIGAMSTQFSSSFLQMQAVQGASLVGHDVVLPGNKLDIDATTKVGQGGFELNVPADTVKVEVLSPSGAVVDTFQMGAQGAGMHSFDWPAGDATNASELQFRITATAGGAKISSTPLMRDRVNAVATSGSTFNLELERSGTVPYTTVKALN